LISHVFQKLFLKDLFFLSLTPKDIEAKYCGVYAISRLTVSTSNVLSRFKKINEEKDWDQQIKPFNFYTLGFQTIEENGKAVKPLAPFSSNPQEIVYEPFIDYETGEIKQGSHYFKPLSKTIMQYVGHPESKFYGEIRHTGKRACVC